MSSQTHILPAFPTAALSHIQIIRAILPKHVQCFEGYNSRIGRKINNNAFCCILSSEAVSKCRGPGMLFALSQYMYWVAQKTEPLSILFSNQYMECFRSGYQQHGPNGQSCRGIAQCFQ
ncbi:hypothetical protein T4E_8605 [Trichinella pseudospiralis]|uniref:Uncharacterized protein n=1 Tax=Trichinella pseudospiralis TaxID=6337 RepID=A0A0V0XHK0_TRIPS|nr:hypothetical protein T4E_8605 [Trichinella pseudospiralis]